MTWDEDAGTAIDSDPTVAFFVCPHCQLAGAAVRLERAVLAEQKTKQTKQTNQSIEKVCVAY